MSRQLRCIINDNGPRRRSRASYARRKSHEYTRENTLSTIPFLFDSTPRRFLSRREKRSDRRPILRFHLFQRFTTFCNDRRLATMARWRGDARRERKRVRAIPAATASPAEAQSLSCEPIIHRKGKLHRQKRISLWTWECIASYVTHWRLRITANTAITRPNNHSNARNPSSISRSSTNYRRMRDDRRGVYANISFLFVFRFPLSLFSSLFKETILNWNISREEDWNFSISLGNFFFFLSFFLSFFFRFSRTAWPFDPRDSVAHKSYTKVCGQWNLGN